MNIYIICLLYVLFILFITFITSLNIDNIEDCDREFYNIYVQSGLITDATSYEDFVNIHNNILSNTFLSNDHSTTSSFALSHSRNNMNSNNNDNVPTNTNNNNEDEAFNRPSTSGYQPPISVSNTVNNESNNNNNDSSSDTDMYDIDDTLYNEVVNNINDLHINDNNNNRHNRNIQPRISTYDPHARRPNRGFVPRLSPNELPLRIPRRITKEWLLCHILNDMSKTLEFLKQYEILSLDHNCPFDAQPCSINNKQNSLRFIHSHSVVRAVGVPQIYQKSILKDTIFENFKLGIRTALYLCKYFVDREHVRDTNISCGVPTNIRKDICDIKSISVDTVVRFNKYIRICLFKYYYELESTHTQLGGVGKRVQVDESWFHQNKKVSILTYHTYHSI